MTHRSWLQSAVLLAVFCAALPSGAAPSEDAWQAHRKKGDAAAEAGNLPEAIRAWKEAWAQTPTSDLACNVGRAELRSGDARAAAEWLTRCVRLSPPATERRELALQGDELRERDLAASRVGAITFDVEKGAEVFVDGASVGRAPLVDPVFVNPGPHTIRAALGPRSATASIEATKGARLQVALPLSLPRGPRATPPAAGKPAGEASPASPVAPRPPLPAKAPPARACFACGPGLISLTTGIAAAAAVGGSSLIALSDVSYADADVTLEIIRKRTNTQCYFTNADPLCLEHEAATDRGTLYQALGVVLVATAAASALGTIVIALPSVEMKLGPSVGAWGFVGEARW